jgi:nitrate/nitrite transporter NarK
VSGSHRLGAIGGPYGVLLGTFLLSLFVSALQIMPASVLTLIMDDIGIGPTQASWLVSLTLLSPAVMALPVGLTLDRFDNRVVLLAGTTLVVASGVWSWQTALDGAYVQLTLSRLLMGIGIAMTWTAGATIVSAAFAGGRAATATGIYTASAPLGYVVGQAVPPFVSGYASWESNFLLFGAATGASFVLFAVAGYRTASVAEAGETPRLSDFRHVFTHRGVWVVALMSFVAYSLNLFFNSWMPTYLSTELGFSIAESGVLVALFPAMGVLARTSGGVISDRWLGGRRRPVPLGAFLVTVVLVVVVSIAQTPPVLAALMVLSGYFVQLGIGLFYTHVRELVDDFVAGSAIAVLTMASFTGGFSAPAIAGWLIERTGAYLPTFGYAFGLAVLGVALAWIVPEP